MSQAAEAQSYLAMAGFNTQQIISALPGVLNLAAAGQMELARTADIASNILTGFQLETSETGRVVDVMAATMTTANTNIEQLGFAMKYVGPIATQVGLSVEETSAAVAKLSDAGIQGEMAGTQLRAILLSLIDPAAEAAKLMEELGINATDSQGEMYSLAELIKQFEVGLGGLTEAQKAQVASTLVGREAASGFLTLISAGSDTLASYTNELRDSSGVAQELADVQNDTLNGAIKELQSALEAVEISVGDRFAPAIRLAAEELTKVALGFDDMSAPAQNAVLAFGTMSVAAGTLTTGIFALRAALVALQVSFPPLLIGSLIVGGLAAAFAYLNTEADGASEAVNRLNQRLDESPLKRTAEDVRELQEDYAEINKLLERRNEIEEELAGKDTQVYIQRALRARTSMVSQELAGLSDELKEIDEQLSNLGIDTPEKGPEVLERMNEEINKSIPALLELEKAELADVVAKVEHINKVEQLRDQFKELTKQENLSAAQKAELASVIERLKQEYPSFFAMMDEEGRLINHNIDIVDSRIKAEKELTDAASDGSRTRLEVLRQETIQSAKLIETQINNLLNLARAHKPGNIVSLDPSQNYVGQHVMKNFTLPNLTKAHNQHIASINEIEKTLASISYGGGGAGISAPRSSSSGVSGGGTSSSRSAGGSGGRGGSSGSSSTEAGKSAEDIARAALQSEKSLADARKQLRLAQNEDEERVTADHIEVLKGIYDKYGAYLENHEQERLQILTQIATSENDLRQAQQRKEHERFQVSLDWIAEKKKYNELSLDEELAAWERVQARYKEGTDEQKRAAFEIHRIKKELIKEEFDHSVKWIDERKYYDQLSLQEEYDAWKRVHDRYLEGTEERKKAARELYRVQKDINQEYKREASQILRNQQEAHLEQMRKRHEQAIKSLEENLKSVEESYDRQIKAQEEKLRLLDEEYQKEDRLKRLREIDEEIDAVKADQRFEFINEHGERILTYDRARVSELEKNRDDLKEQYEREDIKQAIQSEIDRLRNAKDDKIQILRDEIEATKEANQEELEVAKQRWDDLVKAAEEGTLKFDEYMNGDDGWYAKALKELEGYVDGVDEEMERLKEIYENMPTPPDRGGGSGGGSGYIGSVVPTDSKNVGSSGTYHSDGSFTPKFHSGGIVGMTNFRTPFKLDANEIAAIMQRGEIALQPGQIRSLMDYAATVGGQQTSKGGDSIHIENLMVNADNAEEFWDSLDEYRRSIRAT